MHWTDMNVKFWHNIKQVQPLFAQFIEFKIHTILNPMYLSTHIQIYFEYKYTFSPDLFTINLNKFWLGADDIDCKSL